MADGAAMGYSTNDEEELRLLGENGETEKPRGTTESDPSGVSTWLKNNLKLFIGVLSVLALVVLGIVVGAVSNKHNHNKLERLSRNDFPYSGLRLPGDLEPLRYRIYLHPNLTTFNVFGSTRILFRCLKPTKRVILHFKDNKITNLKLLKGSYLDKPMNSSDVLTQNQFSSNDEKELLMVETEQELEVGKNYTLMVLYNGTLQEKLEGFYRSSYKTKSGEVRYIATTHFESSAARTAFPCFDEPAMKATFKIIIVRSPQHKADSNMKIQSSKQRRDGLYVDHFEESVRMSTYVVAFVVHDFESIESTSSRGVKIRIIAPGDQISQATFAKETAPKVLDFYEKFFKINFPLNKLDLIAIPDFAAGAMENWGLITYRMTSLLYDKDESSDSNKQWVAIVIAHEIAHQWFGNLVTMDWWNDLWLNEGFATFMEFFCTDDIFKEWQMMDQFVISHVQRSLTMDAHSDSHPISVPVKDPKEVNAIFDSISYDKGSSIIRMLKDYLGEAHFDAGLKNYLDIHKFANAKSDDLWSSLNKATKNVVDVKSMMDTWTLQMGFPVVTLKKDEKNPGKCFLTQKHFMTAKGAKPSKESPFGYKWDIPVTYMTSSAKDVVFFNRSKETQEFPCPKAGEWMKMNVDSKGFFRSHYDEENWKLLSQQLLKDHNVFSSSDRANLIDDAFELARTDMLKYETALDLTKYFNKEQDYVPWNSLMASLGYISSMLEGRPGYAVYEKYILKLIQPLVQKLGWKDEGKHLEKYLRGLILGSAVKHGEPSAKTSALQLFRDFKNTKKPIPPNLKGAVYAAGIKYGTQDDWDFLWKRRTETFVSTEKRKIMYSLCETEDKKILQKYLEMCLNSSLIRAQDSASVIIGVSVNKVGTKLAWDFTFKNWDTIYERYGGDSFDISEIIETVFGSAKTKPERDQVVEFFKTHKTGTGKRALNQALESIQNHIDWLDRHEKEVVDWLKKQI